MGWEVKLTYCDSSVYLIWILIVKGRVSSKHFEDKNAKSPPIHTMIMPYAHNYFWSKVFWCTTESECSVSNLFRESKVCNLQVAISSYEQILGFHIAVCDPLFVQILQRQHDLGNVEECYVIWE